MSNLTGRFIKLEDGSWVPYRPIEVSVAEMEERVKHLEKRESELQLEVTKLWFEISALHARTLDLFRAGAALTERLQDEKKP
jgi:predicted nuclease with TOPRIM domain